MNSDTLLVSETFSSIQGESTHAGRLCRFIRLAGCNLRCRYCDTLRALTQESGHPVSIPELVRQTKESGLALVEITGGEPLCQANTPALCKALIDAGFEVLIETNGSLDMSPLPPEVIRIPDIKTPSSGMTHGLFEPNFRALRPCDEVKFVISDRADYNYACAAIKRFDLARQTRNILFSPAFGTMNAQTLVRWMLDDRVPARINMQLHKYIWSPDTEGV